MAASRETEKPSSGGSNESETSELTVSPSFCPSASTVTTQTPDGYRPSSARSSSGSTTPSARGLDRVAPDLGDRGTACEPQSEIEVGAEVPDHLADALLAAGREAPHERTAGPDGGRPQPHPPKNARP